LSTYHIHFVHDVPSTNTFLKEQVKARNIQDPYAVSASMQSEGRGQRLNKWLSQPHANMLASFLVSKPGKIGDIARLNNAAALAVVQCLEAYHVGGIKVKWPNDVYVNSKKIAGILTENTFADGGVKDAIVGIGLNVNQLDFGELNATSIALLTKRKVDVVEVLHQVYDAFYYFINQESGRMLLAVNELLYKKNETVTFAQGERTYLGSVQAILANGNLLIRADGKTMEIEHHITKWIK
jgi:BirA family biotin operon repressor/biotin-[acetyl-CoA-carboxylase] ligase